MKPAKIALAIQIIAVVLFWISFLLWDRFMSTELLAVCFMAWGFALGWAAYTKKGGE